ncbi:MAG: GNAT family N-acetyltransferase [Solirubrobacterales bacterium]
MYDGSAIAAAEIRFREDLWRTAPRDAVEEAGVEYQRFGPLLATAFGELPHTSLLNIVQGAAEPEVVAGGRLAAAVEWLRTWEVDYRVSVAADRPGTREAEDWLSSRGYEPGGTVRRYVHTDRSVRETPADGIEIRNLKEEETEGMSHIFADALGLPNLATVLMIGLPRWEGWSCYAAYVEGREVACGSMRVNGNLALLGLDATLPEFRERGCQSALIARRLVDATRTGCGMVAAEVWNGHPASSAAAEVLERAGFEEIAGRTNWRRPRGIA